MSLLTPPALAVDRLVVHFPVAHDWLGRPVGYAHALNAVDLAVERGETLGIVGESGCGKSTLANVLTGLVAPTGGAVAVDGAALVPGRPTARIQMVFQDPNASLDPRLPVWRVVTEPLFLHRRLPKVELRSIAARLLDQVGLRAEHIDRYPHEFSGGQRQRIAIARALAPDPDIVVLDEPTSALDVSVQAQILNLLIDLQRRRRLTYLFISHNVSVIRHVADRVAVMYLGQVVESGPAALVLSAPRHPYTRLLLDSVPAVGHLPDDRAAPDSGELPSNRRLPGGCFFENRCPLARPGCERRQDLTTNGGDHQVRCHLA
jgi:peptide/nickel transport system ATP-binding protein